MIVRSVLPLRKLKGILPVISGSVTTSEEAHLDDDALGGLVERTWPATAFYLLDKE